MKRTIKKVLDELLKDKPDLSYIKGMLEVLIDEEEVKTHVSIPQIINNIPTYNEPREEIPAAARVGRIANLS